MRPLLLASLALCALACGAGADTAALVAKPPVAPSEDALRTFLHSVDGTYGWQAAGELSYDFFPDGRVHIQGDDGEATMWGGDWRLSGDQLTIASSELGDKTVSVARHGDKLVLGGVAYARYAP